MATLLQIHSSINGDKSASSTLVREFTAAWRDRNANGRVITRDLGANPVPHLDGARFGGFLTPEDARTAGQAADVAISDELVEELQAADTIVLGVPMYNFSVPSTFKAWMDHVARAGITFRYTETGPVGLLEGKRAVVISARGGVHAGGETDSQTPLLRTFLGFLGIEDVEFVYAEGLAMGDAALETAFAGARDRIRDLIATKEAA